MILRHQIWFLVKEKGLPAELETIVFDLWALRITRLGDKVSSHEGSDSQAQKKVFSSLQSEDSDATDNERGTLGKARTREQKLLQPPNLKDCLALCYLGILTLKLPITPGDMFAWIIDGKLAYQRAIKLLPPNMRDKKFLVRPYVSVLDPNSLLKHKGFYTAVTDVQFSLAKAYGIVWPSLNIHLLLFRFLKELALPLELYATTIRLGELLDHDFKLQSNSDRRLGIRHLPEAQLVGCLLVCVKLLYPFINEERHPEAPTEPTAARLDWREWCAQMKTARTKLRGDNQSFTTKEMAELTEKDVFSMSSERMDQYLDYYANMLLDEAETQRTRDKDKTGLHDELFEYFPIEGQGTHPPVQVSDGLSFEERLEVVRMIHNSMEPVKVMGEEYGAGVMRPGQNYPSWKSTRDLPEYAKTFYEAVAELAGLSLDMLVQAVFFTEARVEQWRRREARRDRESASPMIE